MTADSVRAILDGRKTQTRRMVKNQPPEGYDLFRVINKWAEFENHVEPLGKFSTACPYGIPGDRLWVRETFFATEFPNKPSSIVKNPIQTPDGWAKVYYAADGEYEKGAWKSPLFMPRRLSRITLEILSVRVERVQEISDDDAEAEGMMYFGETLLEPIPADKYAKLWDTLNAKRGYPWADNPWVWVIEFRVLP